MNWIVQFVRSTIGRKWIAGLTGLGLVGFALVHMVGNLNMFKGAAAMHEYAEALHHIAVLEHYRLLWIAEIGLAGMFLVHVVVVMSLILENRKARGPQRYAVTASKRTNRVETIASKTMAFSGIVLLTFLVVHIWQFRVKRSIIEHSAGGIGAEVVDVLSNPAWGALYSVAGVLVGWHIFHGVQSATRSFGLNHPKYSPIVRTLGFVVSIVVGVGFTALSVATMVGIVNECGLASSRDVTACIADVRLEETHGTEESTHADEAAGEH